MRILVLAVAIVVLAVRPAAACGAWDMTDVVKKLSVSWLINAGSIERHDHQIAALYLDLDPVRGMRVAADHEVIFDFAGKKLRRHGKVIGSVDGDTATITGHIYTFEFSERKIEHGLHDIEIDSWKVVVKRGDQVVITSDRASALCAPLHAKVPLDEAAQRDEVRRRIMFYLAWRELGM